MAPMSWMSPWILANTPMEFSTPHTTAVATTVAMPRAMDSRKDSFITDHGSTRETTRRIRRGPVSSAAGAGCAAPPAGRAAPPLPAGGWCTCVCCVAGAPGGGMLAGACQPDPPPLVESAEVRTGPVPRVCSDSLIGLSPHLRLMLRSTVRHLPWQEHLPRPILPGLPRRHPPPPVPLGLPHPLRFPRQSPRYG